MIRILLVRHGETDWNKTHRLQGHSDIPLAESGELQARTTGAFVRAQNPAQAYVSSLIRTQQTFAQFGLELEPTVWDELREQNLGEWEGAFAAEIRDAEPENFEGWRAGSYTPTEGETHEALQARMTGAFSDIVRGTAQIAPTGSPDLGFEVRTAVVVSHGAALRVLFEGLGLLDRRQFIPLTPAAVTVIDIPLTSGSVSSSLPNSGLDEEHDDDAEARAIAALTDAEIADHARLRLINLSPELLNPGLPTPAI